MRYCLIPGTSVEPLHGGWAAFSPASGETMLLNTEAAAILEVLALGPAEGDSVCRDLASDAGVDESFVAQALRHAWDSLVSGGLIRVDRPVANNCG